MNATMETPLKGFDSIATVTAPPAKRYHVGIHKTNPPASFVTVAGICFPVKSSVYDDQEAEHVRDGDFLELTESQIKRFQDEIRYRVARWKRDIKTGQRITGKKAACDVWDTRTTGFTLEPGDEPLARYLYFKPAPVELASASQEADLFADVTRALEEARASEDKHAADPRDHAEREKHGRLKASGSKVSAASDL